jgi:hypothetical protein
MRARALPPGLVEPQKAFFIQRNSQAYATDSVVELESLSSGLRPACIVRRLVTEIYVLGARLVDRACLGSDPGTGRCRLGFLSHSSGTT